MSEDTLTITALCGSLRKESFNKKVLAAMGDLAADHWVMRYQDLSAIPLYNEDVEKEGDPASVADLKESMRQSDGVLIVTPEYNNGIPGVLKNALDWVSSPPGTSPLIEKPVAVAGATPGGGGTAQSQAQVRQTLLAIDAYTLPSPKIYIRRVHQLFDETTGRLNDERTLIHLKQFLAAFERWIHVFKRRS